MLIFVVHFAHNCVTYSALTNSIRSNTGACSPYRCDKESSSLELQDRFILDITISFVNLRLFSESHVCTMVLQKETEKYPANVYTVNTVIYVSTFYKTYSSSLRGHNGVSSIFGEGSAMIMHNAAIIIFYAEGINLVMRILPELTFHSCK